MIPDYLLVTATALPALILGAALVVLLWRYYRKKRRPPARDGPDDLRPVRYENEDGEGQIGFVPRRFEPRYGPAACPVCYEEFPADHTSAFLHHWTERRVSEARGLPHDQAFDELVRSKALVDGLLRRMRLDPYNAGLEIKRALEEFWEPFAWPPEGTEEGEHPVYPIDTDPVARERQFLYLIHVLDQQQRREELDIDDERPTVGLGKEARRWLYNVLKTLNKGPVTNRPG